MHACAEPCRRASAAASSQSVYGKATTAPVSLFGHLACPEELHRWPVFIIARATATMVWHEMWRSNVQKLKFCICFANKNMKKHHQKYIGCAEMFSTALTAKSAKKTKMYKIHLSFYSTLDLHTYNFDHDFRIYSNPLWACLPVQLSGWRHQILRPCFRYPQPFLYF